MKEIIIIGGNSGIGAATTKLLSKKFNIIFTYSSSIQNAKLTLAKCDNSKKNSIKFHRLDLTNLTSINKFSDFVSKKYKNIKGVIFNSAAPTERKSYEDIHINDLIKMYKINFQGHFLIGQKMLKIIKKQNRTFFKNFIFISSEATRFGGNKLSHYVPTKASINVLVKALSNELQSEKILVNAVSPGIIMTDMMSNANKLKNNDMIKKQIEKSIPLGRIGKPIEVANIIYFLLARENKLLNNKIFSVNGGR